MKSKEFNALIIDASTDNLYVMLLSQSEVLGGKSCDSIKKHSETVMTEIDRVLKLGGLKLGDVDVFVCGVGCGSFTGLRVAISTVKGLNAPLGKNLLPSILWKRSHTIEQERPTLLWTRAAADFITQDMLTESKPLRRVLFPPRRRRSLERTEAACFSTKSGI